MTARMLAGMAALVAALLGGCTVRVAVVRERPTAGEALRRCEVLRRSGALDAEAAAEIRAMILREGPALAAGAQFGLDEFIWGDGSITEPRFVQEGPALYATPAAEREWLDRAMKAELVTAEERAAALDAIERQRRRAVVRTREDPAARERPADAIEGFRWMRAWRTADVWMVPGGASSAADRAADARAGAVLSGVRDR